MELVCQSVIQAGRQGAASSEYVGFIA